MATIRELSESIGISKVGLNKWIERNGYKDRLEKIGNKYVIPADLEQVIRSYFDRRDTKPAEVEEQTVSEKKDITDEILSLLREQLETKDREIERLHKQVDDLQKINADMVKAVRELNTIQAMQLTDGSERTREELERENPERTKSEPRDLSKEEPKKRSLWDRLKSRF